MNVIYMNALASRRHNNKIYQTELNLMTSHFLNGSQIAFVDCQFIRICGR